MIRDGIDQPRVARKLRRDGWMPIETAPLVNRSSYRPDEPLEGNVVEGLTTHGYQVEAHYDATGDYEDRWTNRYGNIIYRLTHRRPLR